jgi:hypothetical protein
MNTRPKTLASAKSAVVTVSSGGRGFLVNTPRGALVVTAAHCLPKRPPAHRGSFSAERTFRRLLGPLGTAKPLVWAECCFVDPVADLAVLCSPDYQEMSEHAEAYDQLVEAHTTLRIGMIKQTCRAWLLTLEGQWVPCTVRPDGCLEGAPADGIARGTSGSPVLTADGKAVACIGCGSTNAVLANDLPARMLAAFAESDARR